MFETQNDNVAMEKESYQMKLEFHHINYVSEDVDRLHKFYTEVLGMTDIPAEHFPRPKMQQAQVDTLVKSSSQLMAECKCI